MRTLVTGAGGYIGLHILRELLEDGQQVTALLRAPEKLGNFARHPGLRIVVADLEDTARVNAALADHDTCIHAALIWGTPGEELEARDVAACARLFDAAGRAGVARCIYLSSAAVHRPFAGVMDEDDSLRPADLYGATKAAGELFLRAACAQHRMTGIVVRPGPVVGPPAFPGGSLRSPGPIVEMVQAAAEGSPLTVMGEDGRQFTDVAALARAMRLLTRTADPHPTYLCVDRELIIWQRIAKMVLGCANSPSSVRLLPRQGPDPIPHFRTERIESLLGGPTDAAAAMAQHIRLLCESDRRRAS